MMEFLSSGEPWVKWVISAGIFALFVLLAFASRFILNGIMHPFAKRTKTILDDLIIKALTGPVFALMIAAGLWIAVTRLPEVANYVSTIHKVFIIIYIGIAAVAVVRITHAILSWYTTEIAPKTKTEFDDRLIPILRRVADVIIYAIALMIVLDQLNINISPILASLGIGGLAVALALQPTLSNFLSGTYVISDSVIRKGDYIQLDGGPEGTVEDIGWRTTKIRHWQGNLIVLPNSKLSDAIVTDFERPESAMLFTVDCGVSYDSDLEQVERVSIEVAKNLLENHPLGAKDFTPVLRFKAFGDSNINFAVTLKGIDRAAQYTIKHDFIKALHKRFKAEGIDIQYPVRKLLFADKTSLEKTRNQN
jgi:small-conductance mechanosensitive channel